MSIRALLNSFAFRQAGTSTRGERRQRGRRAVNRACLEALENRRLMSFSPAVSYPAGEWPQDVVTGDFNNDGNLDLAALNGGGSYVVGPGNTITVRLGDGLGGFGAANSFPTNNGPRSMAVGDFNNDGNLDVVTVNYIVNSIGPIPSAC